MWRRVSVGMLSIKRVSRHSNTGVPEERTKKTVSANSSSSEGAWPAPARTYGRRGKATKPLRYSSVASKRLTVEALRERASPHKRLEARWSEAANQQAESEAVVASGVKGMIRRKEEGEGVVVCMRCEGQRVWVRRGGG